MIYSNNGNSPNGHSDIPLGWNKYDALTAVVKAYIAKPQKDVVRELPKSEQGLEILADGVLLLSMNPALEKELLDFMRDIRIQEFGNRRENQPANALSHNYHSAVQYVDALEKLFSFNSLGLKERLTEEFLTASNHIKGAGALHAVPKGLKHVYDSIAQKAYKPPMDIQLIRS